jgi:hypothetical protein
MPAKSKAQQRLMAAAEHGATFPMAEKLRQSMSLGQLHDFASGSMKGKPAHVEKAAGLKAAHASHPNASRLGKYLHPKRFK